MSGKSRDGYRSSVSGRFVKEQYAKTHPHTTEHEKLPPPPPKKGK